MINDATDARSKAAVGILGHFPSPDLAALSISTNFLEVGANAGAMFLSASLIVIFLFFPIPLFLSQHLMISSPEGLCWHPLHDLRESFSYLLMKLRSLQ